MIGAIAKKRAPGGIAAAGVLIAALMLALMSAMVLPGNAYAANIPTTTKSDIHDALVDADVHFIRANMDLDNATVNVKSGTGLKVVKRGSQDWGNNNLHDMGVIYTNNEAHGGSGAPRTLRGTKADPLVDAKWSKAAMLPDGSIADVHLKLVECKIWRNDDDGEGYDDWLWNGDWGSSGILVMGDCIDDFGCFEMISSSFPITTGYDVYLGVQSKWVLEIDTSKNLSNAHAKSFVTDLDVKHAECESEGITVTNDDVNRCYMHPDHATYIKVDRGDSSTSFTTKGVRTGADTGGDTVSDIWPSGVAFDWSGKSFAWTWQGSGCGTDFGVSLEDPTAFTPKVKKKAVGFELQANQFTFNLYNEAGDVVATTKNDADGTVAFEPITLFGDGEHKYTVKEVVPANTGDIKYDTRSIDIVVDVSHTVTTTGVLKYKRDSVTYSPRKTFTNKKDEETYTGTWAPHATKLLEGADLKKNQFTFEATGTGGYDETVKNKADGTVTFPEDEFEMKEGDGPITRTYTVKEVRGDDSDMQYDTHTLTYTVTATLSGNEVKITEKSSGSTTFTNRKYLTKTWKPTAKKAGNGIGELSGYRFEVKRGDTVLATGVSDTNGNVNFDMEPLTYRVLAKGGELVTDTITVRELGNSDGKISNDKHTCVYNIVAGYNESTGKLAFAVTPTATGTMRSSDPTTFVNMGPPPEPTKKVDKEYAEVDEHVTYTVTQTAAAGYEYDSLVFADPVDDRISYDEGSFRVKDKNGRDVTASAGEFKIVNEKTSVWLDPLGYSAYDSSKALRYTFKKSWLAANVGATDELTFTFTAKVLKPAAGKVVYNRASTYTNNTLLQWTPPTGTRVPVWYVDILKKAEYPDLLVDNPAYSVAGAKFSVVDGQGVRENVTSDKDGKTDRVTVYHSGTVTATETTPPAGHKLPDPASKTAKLTKDNSGQTFSFEFVDPPYVLDVPVIAKKVDADRYEMYRGGNVEKAREPQGDARDFSGFKVRVDFYAGDKPTGKKLASAVFASDKTGAVAFGSATPVDGTTWRYVYKGKNVLPLGCVTVTEVGAPAGYDVSKDTYVATVVVDGGKAVLVPGENWRHDG